MRHEVSAGEIREASPVACLVGKDSALARRNANLVNLASSVVAMMGAAGHLWGWIRL